MGIFPYFRFWKAFIQNIRLLFTAKPWSSPSVQPRICLPQQVFGLVLFWVCRFQFLWSIKVSFCWYFFLSPPFRARNFLFVLLLSGGPATSSYFSQRVRTELGRRQNIILVRCSGSLNSLSLSHSQTRTNNTSPVGKQRVREKNRKKMFIKKHRPIN